MKKISLLSAITLTIFLQSISGASASEAGMSNSDFTRLACGYLQKIDSKSEAIDKITATTESKINDRQLAMIEEIKISQEATEDFCRSSRPRL